MEVIGILLFVSNWIFSMISIDIIFGKKNMKYIFHLVSFFTIASLYFIWYYGNNYRVEFILFFVFGTMFYAYQSFKRDADTKIIKRKINYVSYVLIASILLTIVIRVAF